jgi:hypothetical protein
MSGDLILHVGRVNVVPLGLGFDVSGDEFTSQIRKEKSVESDLLAEWDVTFANDGTDGELVMILAADALNEVSVSSGYTDLKRVSNGQPLSVFSEPIPVVFEGVVTA